MGTNGNVSDMQDTPTPGTEEARGAIIRMLRESRGLSSADLGRMVGRSDSLIRRIELGSLRANLGICMAIATALEIPVARIVGDDVAKIIDPRPAQVTS